MEVLVILFLILAVAGGIVFFSWLYNSHPPIDVDAEMRKMKARKEIELEAYRRGKNFRDKI